jgi:hypothetical protein
MRSAADARFVGRVEAVLLIEDASNARYVEPGYLIYGRSSNLYAWRFDAKGLREGEAAPIVAEKLSYMEPKNFVPFAAAADGTSSSSPKRGERRKCAGTIARDARSRAWARPDSTMRPGFSRWTQGGLLAFRRGLLFKTNIWCGAGIDRTVRLSSKQARMPTRLVARRRPHAFMCAPKGIWTCASPVARQRATSAVTRPATRKSGSWMPDGNALVFSSRIPNRHGHHDAAGAESHGPRAHILHRSRRKSPPMVTHCLRLNVSVASRSMPSLSVGGAVADHHRGRQDPRMAPTAGAVL